MKKNDLPRFNMPYELGLDIGCMEFGGNRFLEKRILILESEKYHYQKVLSDIAGQDISHHENDPNTLVKRVRNWFSTIYEDRIFPSANVIWLAFNQFYDDLLKNLLSSGYTQIEIEEMPIGDFIKFAKKWIREFKS